MDEILVFVSDQFDQEIISSALEDSAVVTFKSNKEDFWQEIQDVQFDLVFLGVGMASKKEIKLLQEIHRKCPHIPILVIGEIEKADVVARIINNGASDFLLHPVTPSAVRVAVLKAIENRDLKNEIAYLRRKQDVVYDFKEIIAFSPSMKEVLKSLEKFSRTDSTILITGATGTGKSFLSGAIHFNSLRKKKPFVKINCANIQENLLESELFGHEKGAFTGADKLRVGRFEQASGGTLFLDEIGDISLALQTKLLRVLEEKSFERVGGNKTIYADVRVIAATNRDLMEQIHKGQFREDLFYRINVLPIRMPNLKERHKCISPLAENLLQKSCQTLRKKITGFTPAAMDRICHYEWPGNIRQLANTIERAVILEEDEIIHQDNLFLPSDAVQHISLKENISYEDVSLESHEKDLILLALEETLWVQKYAAIKLGVSPRALNYKVKKFGITHPNWRKNKGEIKKK